MSPRDWRLYVPPDEDDGIGADAAFTQAEWAEQRDASYAADRGLGVLLVGCFWIAVVVVGLVTALVMSS